MKMYFESVNKRIISESSQVGYHFSHIFISETTIKVDQLYTRPRSEADWLVITSVTFFISETTVKVDQL